MAPETLSTRRLNRALLARQLLLERSTAPIPQVLEQVGGLQMQYAPSGYIGLWSRMAGFERPMLTRALEQRTVIQATLMRATIHLVSAADYWPLTAAVRRTRREWFERVTRGEIERLDMDGAARAVRRELAEGPLPLAELTRRLTAARFGERSAGWSGYYVDLVRVPPSGTWERRRADRYALADQWLPIAGGASEPSEEEGAALLVRRYLAGFGPARLADAADWAGLPPALLQPVSDRLELRRFHDEQGRELIDLPDAPLPAEDTPAPVRFLPTWDATLLVHARRTQILPERYRSRVFNTRTPHSTPTFLVEGEVAGTWRHEDGEIRLEPFEPLPPAVRREVEAEAHDLARFHA